jgi:hypothetical protein
VCLRRLWLRVVLAYRVEVGNPQSPVGLDISAIPIAWISGARARRRIVRRISSRPTAAPTIGTPPNHDHRKTSPPVDDVSCAFVRYSHRVNSARGASANTAKTLTPRSSVPRASTKKGTAAKSRSPVMLLNAGAVIGG